MKADERDDWDYKYDSWIERGMIKEMEAEDLRKARTIFEMTVKRLQLAITERNEIERRKKSLGDELYAQKMSRVNDCIKVARRSVEVAKTAYERAARA